MVDLQPSSERRHGIEELPTDLRRRLECALGSHIVNISHSSSGASPGWAASLVGANGERAFLKAILNDSVPAAVRRLKIESRLLEWLPSYSFIPTIIDVARTARWTSVLMEDVNGKHPDLRHSGDADCMMTQVIDHLGAITPPTNSIGVKTLHASWLGWGRIWAGIRKSPEAFLPQEFPLNVDEVLDRMAEVPDDLFRNETVCHWDLVSDNIIMRNCGQPVFIDWGLARIGPAWADAFRLSLEWVDQDRHDDAIERICSVFELPQRLVTTLVLVITGLRAWNAKMVDRDGLRWDRGTEGARIERMVAGSCRRVNQE